MHRVGAVLWLDCLAISYLVVCRALAALEPTPAIKPARLNLCDRSTIVRKRSTPTPIAAMLRVCCYTDLK